MKWIAYLASLVGAVAVAIMVLITAWAVFTRYVLHNPLTWVEEISGFLMGWIVLVSAIACEARNENLTIDLLENALPPRIRKVFSSAVALASIGLLIVLGWLAWKLAGTTAFRKTQILHISFFWFYVAFCVGAAGLVVVTLLRLFQPPLQSDDDPITGHGLS